MLRLVLLELRDVVFRMSLESWTLWIVIPTMEKELEDVGVKKRKQQANNPHCGRKFSGAQQAGKHTPQGGRHHLAFYLRADGQRIAHSEPF